MHRSPEVGELEAEDHVGAGDQRAAALGMIQRVARGEIHSPALIDHRGLQGFGQFDQQRHPGGRARGAIRDDYRVFRGYQ